jgi:hypothetical protein
MRRSLIAIIPLSILVACGTAPTSTAPPDRPALTSILKETKFVPRDDYTGADTPEDLMHLQTAVDDAIRDVISMSDPLDADKVRERLEDLLSETNWFATEDRDEVGRYAVRIWRAAGFKKDSGLFPVGDDRALS